jgi:hypothetical protein
VAVRERYRLHRLFNHAVVRRCEHQTRASAHLGDGRTPSASSIGFSNPSHLRRPLQWSTDGWSRRRMDGRRTGRTRCARLPAPGAASEEYINAYRCLWQDEVAEFDGEFVSFKNVIALPKPVQQPGPPIWIGDEGPGARRRVARLGDGWYPACCNPRYPLDTVERFTEAVNDVRQRTEAGGRDPDEIEIALFVPWAKLGEPVMKDGKRMVFTGPTDAILEDIASFENGGLDVFIPSLIAPSVGEIVDNCEAFAAAIGMG